MAGCTSNSFDYNNLRHAFWSQGDGLGHVFSPETIGQISSQISYLTKGLDKKGRTIVVPDSIIGMVLDGVYQKYKRSVGDIHSRYIIDSDAQDNTAQTLIDQAIEVITSGLINEYGIEDNNNNLSAWVQVMGDFSTNGLRAHPVIKTQEKRPSTMQFFENY